MPKIYVSTGFFVQNSLGWSESWYRNTELTDLHTISDNDLAASNIWQARAGMLCDEARLTDVRTSFVDTVNDAWPQTPNFIGPGLGSGEYGALACLWRFNRATDGRFKNVYLRGIPDALSTKGGLLNIEDPALLWWKNAANKWANRIVSLGWGWYGAKIDPTKKVIGTAYAPDVNDARYTDITLQAPGIVGAVAGDVITVHFKKVNYPFKSKLNGRHKCRVVSATSLQPLSAMALFPHNGRQFEVYPMTPDLVVPSDSEPRKIVRHDTGRPFGAPRGRLPARPPG